mgnify:CR=1 FL=1
MTELDFGGGFKSSRERLREEGDHRRALAKRVIPFNISYLDDCCLGIYPTDLIIISAATGAGKTTIAALLSQLAAEQDRRVHFFALEAHRSEIEQRMLFRELLALIREKYDRIARVTFAEWMYGRCGIPASVENEAAERLADKTKGLRTFYRDRKFSAEDITKQFLAIQNETDLIVLDHLHYVDSDDQNDNRGLKTVTKALRDAAIDMEKPVIVVAHLRKKDRSKPRLIPDENDVHGSSDIAKIATKIIMLAPARDQSANSPQVASTYMQVVKDRFVGATGIAALMSYDLTELRYYDKYCLGRISFDGTEFEIIPAEQRPRWAKRAI